jgi:hypothetical protein
MRPESDPVKARDLQAARELAKELRQRADEIDAMADIYERDGTWHELVATGTAAIARAVNDSAR